MELNEGNGILMTFNIFLSQQSLLIVINKQPQILFSDTKEAFVCAANFLING